jgi:plastocyanin
MRSNALLALFLLASAAPARAEVVVVRQVGFFFTPREVVIRPGDSVRWVWTGGSHTVTEGTDGVINGNELWTSPLSPSVPSFQWDFTPAFLAAHPKPDGRYDYFCQPHFVMGMTGVVWVADPAPGAEFCSGDGSGAACPCGAAGPAGSGCPNSVGSAARLRASGTASASADSLKLWVSGAPEGSTVLFFQGDGTLNGGAGAAFGEGLRCAGGSLVRLGQKTQSFGWARYPDPGDVPVSQRGFAQPGTTRHYQVWYQDSPGVCGPPAPNLSNGVTVTWQ